MMVQSSVSDLQSWIAAYGLWVVFGALILENVLFVGMIVPGLFVLVVAGFMAAHGSLSFGYVLVVAIFGVWIGDFINYGIGRFFWGPLLGRNHRANTMLQRIGWTFAHRGSLIFAIYHFDPISRMFGSAVVGASRVPIRRWLPYDYFGAVVWVGFYTSIGYMIGRMRWDLENWNSVQPVQIAAILIVLAWIIFVSRSMRRMVDPPA